MTRALQRIPLLRPTRRGVRHLRRRVAEPGSRPDGWHTGPPDFVGVGVQRSGTSWWYRLITDHPAVVGLSAASRRLGPTERPDPRGSIPAPAIGSLWMELHFFDWLAAEGLSPEQVELYHRFFPRPDGFLAGEWTPRYLYDFWTPALLQRAAPHTRILVMLRDPVERFGSAMSRERRLAREAGREPAPAAWAEAFERGRYATQLKRLLRQFDSSRVLVLQYERCVADPRAELRRSYEFLRAEPVDHVPAGLTATVGPVAQTGELTTPLRDRLTESLREEVQGTVELFPGLDLGAWPNFSRL